MNFPVSIKGVLVEAGRVVLLENERDEWELPGGRLEPGEAPETCLVREFAEELGCLGESRPYNRLLALRGFASTRGRHRHLRCETTRRARVAYQQGTSAIWVVHTSRNRSVAGTRRLPPFNTRMVCTTRSAPVESGRACRKNGVRKWSFHYEHHAFCCVNGVTVIASRSPDVRRPGCHGDATANGPYRK